MWRPCIYRSVSRQVRLTVKPAASRDSLGLSRDFVAAPPTCSRRAFSSSSKRSGSSVAALKPTLHSTVIQQIEAFPEVLQDDLPMVSMGDHKVAVGWNTRTWSRYHHIWLRDHCRCPKCFHPVTKQRLLNTFEISPTIKPIHVEPIAEGLQVTWPEAEPHISLYPWSWLQTNSYDPPVRRTSKEPILWGSKIDKAPPTVTYEEAMDASDRGLYKWLSKIDRFGFCFVSGVPVTAEATEELAQRISFIRETQYGKFWDFTSDLSKGDTAYTTLALGAHTDNTYFTDPCGLQLFHLLSHTDGSGGATLLVDGFYVADILKQLHPEVYDILSRVSVPAHAAGEPNEFFRPSPTSGFPVLSHDTVTSELTKVRWNNDDRSVMNALDPYMVEEWYNAIRTWNKLITSHDSEYWLQLTPGTAVVINNHRVLHGRSAFDGKRRMCGAYIGMDEYHSKLAVLSEKFASTHPSNPAGSIQKRSVWDPKL